MGGPKPTLGFPSRTEACLWLRGKGFSTREIAARVGIDETNVVALEYSAQRTKSRGGCGADKHGTINIYGVGLVAKLAPVAAARGITANELARRIVETVIDDGLIDAVLDDREDETDTLRSEAGPE